MEQKNFMRFLIIFAIGIVLVAGVILTLNYLENQPRFFTETNSLETFNSTSDISDFLKTHQARVNYAGGDMLFSNSAATSKSSESAGGATQYSQTNIQVEGVDEPDIVKNDGKYIYTITGDKVVIVNAYPAGSMQVVSEINFSGTSIKNIFINGNKLIVFGDDYSATPAADVTCIPISEGVNCSSSSYGEQRTLIYIYDISDKENPELENNISMSGNYFDSRMIDNYIYVVSNKYLYGGYLIMPYVTNNGAEKEIASTSMYYPDINETGYQFTTFMAVNINNGETSEKVLLNPSTSNLYVSERNIYAVYDQWSSHPVMCIRAPCYNQGEERTIITKVSIDRDQIAFVAVGSVPGHILNQFSMDEYNNYFRIATTVGEVWGGNSKNNIYVLDENLNLTGKLEDLAPGEKIYSSRFIGNRGYLVTFKKVDPLFVIDLKDPSEPKILGKLKIPGYSDYLHPYDENHIIGVGKEAIDADSELVQQRNLDFAWYQGVKIALFDVSDVENPKELSKVVIGDRGTDSYALQDHKAFLFDKSKNLLVLPITLAEIKGEKTADNQYGEFVFQGAYVYRLTLEDGFEFKGRITHYEDNETFLKSGYYLYGGGFNIQRSLYMDNTLYTISNSMIKANNLDNLDEINSVNLPYEQPHYGYYEYWGI